jgi:hypothetical protein
VAAPGTPGTTQTDSLIDSPTASTDEEGTH